MARPDQRYYNPWFGRFNTPDPSTGVNAADPVSWNTYAYVHSDPVNFYDPKGLVAQAPTGPVYDDDSGILTPIILGGWNPAMDVTGLYITAFDQIAGQVAVQAPSCEGLLTATIAVFLLGKGSPLAADAAQFVQVGQQDNVDPRLLVAIAGNESGYGTSPLAQRKDNAFGTMRCRRVDGKTVCSPAQYSDFGQSISAAGGILENQIYGPKQNDTVNLLYSGQKGAYCVDTDPKFPCSNGARNVSNILATLGGNPNSLGFPCPPEQ